MSERYAISPPTIDEYLSLPDPEHWLTFFFVNFCYWESLIIDHVHITPIEELFKLSKLLPSIWSVLNLTEYCMFLFAISWYQLNDDSFRNMAFRMKRILNEQKMIERAVVNKTLISAKWASDSSSVEAIIVPDCESFLFPWIGGARCRWPLWNTEDQDIFPRKLPNLSTNYASTGRNHTPQYLQVVS